MTNFLIGFIVGLNVFYWIFLIVTDQDRNHKSFIYLLFAKKTYKEDEIRTKLYIYSGHFLKSGGGCVSVYKANDYHGHSYSVGGWGSSSGKFLFNIAEKMFKVKEEN
jgi:hypothetical protein